MGWITAVPNLFGARDQFKGRHVFPQTGVGAWFGGDSRGLHSWCTSPSLLLHQLHFRSPGIDLGDP